MLDSRGVGQSKQDHQIPIVPGSGGEGRLPLIVLPVTDEVLGRSNFVKESAPWTSSKAVVMSASG